MLRLFSYKMTHDTGFAPNPFWGELTLATCKPQIRLKKREGDWIAGFTSKELCRGDPVGSEKLVYLMRVERILPLARYFQDPHYKNKIPDPTHSLGIRRAGDNIYRPLPSASGCAFEQLQNENHGRQNMGTDLSGRFVLTSSEFVYFGGEAILIPTKRRPTIPKGQSGPGCQTHDEQLAKRFIEYVLAKGSGILAAPHCWPADDLSWQQNEDTNAD